MTYTYTGTQLPESWDWCPLATANGIQDAILCPNFKNLYRFRRAPTAWALYLVGRLMGRFHDPAWVPRGVR